MTFSDEPPHHQLFVFVINGNVRPPHPIPSHPSTLTVGRVVRPAWISYACCWTTDGSQPNPSIHPSRQYRGVVVVYTMANDAAAEREIPFVVCNCCAHRLPENVTGILIFNRHSAFVHPIRLYVFAHSRALPGLDSMGEARVMDKRTVLTWGMAVDERTNGRNY